MYIYVWQGGGPRRPIGDVQTDVHIVPVDSDSPLRNLLKVQTVRCALVLYKGNLIPHPAPSLVFQLATSDETLKVGKS